VRVNWSEVKYALGRLLNLAGYPAVVRECEYSSRALGAEVKVRKLALYTLVSVNGLDIYFNRLSGTIDGVGANPNADCRLGAFPKSTDLDVEPDSPSIPKRNTEGPRS
jgi:hypothetical protein